MDSKTHLFGWFGKSPKVARVGMACVFVCAFLFAGVGLVRQAHASGTWYVKVGGNDASDCMSPAAACASINGALAKPGFVAGDTIKVGVGRYTGSGYEVVLIQKHVVLLGGWDMNFASRTGMSVLDGENARRGINVVLVRAVIKHFIIENGQVPLDFVGYNGGAGIINNGNVHLDRVIVKNNHSVGGGGGISNFEGTMTILRSTIMGNTMGNGGSGGGGGGGIENMNGTLKISQSAIYRNSIQGDYYGSGLLSFGNLQIKNSTIAANTGGTGSVKVWGRSTLANVTISGSGQYGLYQNSAWTTLKLRNTIVTGHTIADCSHESDSPENKVKSLGYNVIEDNGNCSTLVTDLTGVDPLLAKIADNGGPTRTQSLLDASPAKNLVQPTKCNLPVDQRGVKRPQGKNCDAGAYESTVP